MRTVPSSSIFNNIINNFKHCCFQFVHTHHIFILSFLFKASVNVVHKNINRAKHFSGDISANHGSYNFLNQNDQISQKKLFLSGDIELNPGPVPSSILSLTRLPPNMVLEERLRCS